MPRSLPTVARRVPTAMQPVGDVQTQVAINFATLIDNTVIGIRTGGEAPPTGAR
ncbi:MAG: hypothetical protein IPI75_10355 [Gammaproteobacteria bacterium]|nr:hypothetical protein [Gammaproteobacteria bacterium]